MQIYSVKLFKYFKLKQYNFFSLSDKLMFNIFLKNKIKIRYNRSIASFFLVQKIFNEW